MLAGAATRIKRVEDIVPALNIPAWDIKRRILSSGERGGSETGHGCASKGPAVRQRARSAGSRTHASHIEPRTPRTSLRPAGRTLLRNYFFAGLSEPVIPRPALPVPAEAVTRPLSHADMNSALVSLPS